MLSVGSEMLVGCCIADRQRAVCLCSTSALQEGYQRAQDGVQEMHPQLCTRDWASHKPHGSQPSRPGRLRLLVFPMWDIFPTVKGRERFLKELNKNGAGAGGELRSRKELVA